ncbi:MAG: ATPase, T2SS/T4P/T4SS family [Candidatus Omnitrophica bacterium]|nr:ATPase, T2SS/T4P/T4SS family [Candidatus Omnitrophota bacterium]
MALRLGDILIEKRLITAQELELALKEQERTNEVLGRVLLKMGLIKEAALLQAIAEQQGIAFLELRDLEIHDKAIRSVPVKFIWHYNILPLSIAGNILTIAVSNPFDVWPIDDLETNLGFHVEKALATSSDIAEAIKKYYGVGADTIERILTQSPSGGRPEEKASGDKVEDLERMAEDASVVRLVNQIVQRAINDRATDIHIERFSDELLLRSRIDGILYDTPVSQNVKHLYSAIISRVKVMASLDIIERRLPQDGRAKVKIGNLDYDLRISIMPTLYGENIVIRILPTTMLFSVADLGMSKKELETLEDLLKRPNGIIFVTGPTGSGKTTTLYASLSRLNTRERKIVTIEDPIEYELRGISQVQVNPRIGLTFAAVLRSLLRHDPDIMMVGEVRDFETAEITIQTALTGHLVFSTLHTNDAASGITRLIDMGVEPFLISSSVEAFIAQRLVRLICPKCKEEANDQKEEIIRQMEADMADLSGKDHPKEFRIYKGRGCRSCNNTGYVGRTGIYEALLVTEEIKKLILTKAYSDVIKKKALQLGMKTLRQNGWEKVLAGVTTFEEVVRVTQAEE